MNGICHASYGSNSRTGMAQRKLSQDQVELCMYIAYLTFPFGSCVYAIVEFLLPASADHKRIMQNKEIKNDLEG